MSATLTFEPLVSATLWITLAIAAGLGLLWYGVRRPSMVPRVRWAVNLVLMSLSLAIVLVVLLNPTWVSVLPPVAGKPRLTLLVDASESMATPDGPDGQARFQAAASTAVEVESELRRRFDVRLRRFATNVQAADARRLAASPPAGGATDLAGAIADGIEHNRPQGQALCLLSDGIHNAGGGTDRVLDTLTRAKAMGVPIYTRTLGGDVGIKDVAVVLGSPQELAFVRQEVPVHVLISHRGMTGAEVSVVARHRGEEVHRGKELLGPGGTSEFRFSVSRNETGLYHYDVQVEPVEGEVTDLNNTAAFQLRVVDEAVRVLLLEGKPYWDAKFLMRTLASDPSLELESVVRLSDRRLLRRRLHRPAPTAPADGAGAAATAPAADGADGPREEVWAVLDDPRELLASYASVRMYQVIVLGRNAEVFLSDDALANLRKWLSRDGGALVCYRGAPIAQIDEGLEQLLPVRWTPTSETRFHVKMTERGRSLRWIPGALDDGGTLADLPTLAAVDRVDETKPLAVVLATAAQRQDTGDRPVVGFQPYGAGRVVAIEGAGMWRWAFLPRREQDNGDVYHALWNSLIRWLVSGTGLLPGQDFSLRADKLSYTMTESATATLLVREEVANGQVPGIELDGSGLNEVQIFAPTAAGDEPGTFRVVFGELPEGRYEARVGGAGEDETAARTAFGVRAFLDERLELKARPDLMARIAGDTGGAVLTDDPAEQLASGFREHMERIRPPVVRRTSAWDRWWILVAVFAVWATTWGARRAGGLV